MFFFFRLKRVIVALLMDCLLSCVALVWLVLSGVSDKKKVFADNFLKAKPSNASLLHVLCECVKWIGA